MLLPPQRRRPDRFRLALHVAMQIGLSHLISEPGVQSLRISGYSGSFLLIACTRALSPFLVAGDSQGFQHMARFINVTTTVNL